MSLSCRPQYANNSAAPRPINPTPPKAYVPQEAPVFGWASDTLALRLMGRATLSGSGSGSGSDLEGESDPTSATVAASAAFVWILAGAADVFPAGGRCEIEMGRLCCPCAIRIFWVAN